MPLLRAPLFVGLFFLPLVVQGVSAALTGDGPVAVSRFSVGKILDVAPVWAGHPVDFSLLTDAVRRHQYVAFYDAERMMTVAMRRLDDDQWTIRTLDSRVGWDSHNGITMALDQEGRLHVVGNLHVSPLVYYRTAVAGDVSTLERRSRMVPDGREQRMTYPRFLHLEDGGIVFSYRDGQSGRGDTLYNRYDAKADTWSRFLDTPLFDGEGRMNAYPLGPTRGPDGFWHMTWVWRDSIYAETNHDLCYARSRDLAQWETVDGTPIELPIRLSTPGVIVDPVPVNGGIINGSGRLGFDSLGRVLIVWHKFDKPGNTQLYLARAEADGWRQVCITDWHYRWEPKGGGSLVSEIRHSGPIYDKSIGLYLNISHIREGNASYRIDEGALTLGERIPPELLPDALPRELRAALQVPTGMVRNVEEDLGEAGDGSRYILVWETLPANRDRPREGPLPAPRQLRLVELIPTVPEPR